MTAVVNIVFTIVVVLLVLDSIAAFSLMNMDPQNGSKMYHIKVATINAWGYLIISTVVLFFVAVVW